MPGFFDTKSAIDSSSGNLPNSLWTHRISTWYALLEEATLDEMMRCEMRQRGRKNSVFLDQANGVGTEPTA